LTDEWFTATAAEQLCL